MVSPFAGSDAALRAIVKDPSIDILITALEVQPLSGLELCWEARLASSASRPLYIIVMSSLGNEQKLAEALDCGADEMIAKPVQRVELHARLRVAGRLKSAQLHLVSLAETDPLTGVLNRRAYFDRLSRALGEPERAPSIATVMFDIDHFKQVNDRHGHDVGDAVLVRVAALAAQETVAVGRLGGEEFGLIVDGGETRALKLAERLRRACAGLAFQSQSGPFHVTCSLGVSRWMAGDSVETLMKRADVALYRAKVEGRNRVAAAWDMAIQTAPPGLVTRGRTRSV